MLICCKKEIKKILERKTESACEPWAPTPASFLMGDSIMVIHTNRLVISVSTSVFLIPEMERIYEMSGVCPQTTSTAASE